MHGEERLQLSVTGGSGGRRVLVADERVRVVGRALDADLVLDDPSVSRRHAEVRASSPGRATLRVCGGASPVLHGDRAVMECELVAGDRLVIGSTSVSVTRVEGKSSAAPAVTDAATLLSGFAVDVRGLAATFALVGALDAAADLDAARVAVAGWARDALGALDATLQIDDAEAATGLTVTARDRDGSEARAAFETPDGGALVVHLATPPERVSDAQRRILVVAARICASAVSRIRALAAAERENAALRERAFGSARAVLGDSPRAREMAALLPRLASSDVVVLIHGETGTGKTFAARLLHESGPRAKEPFHVVNCAAIPESLIESEMFGHERGAFTGAIATRVGAFEAAGRGTLFLDEIGDLPLQSQAKLLRALEDRRFERVGSPRPIPLRARIVTATNRDLSEMLKAGTFRSDLYFRINVVSLEVPPLRARGEDVILLAEHLLRDLLPSAGRRVDGFTPAALDALRRYSWPGNVRELRNVLERAVVLGDGARIDVRDLPDAVRGTPAPQPSAADGADVVHLPAALEELEARAIEAALRATGGNRTRAAALLGIGRVTLYKKLREEPSS